MYIGENTQEAIKSKSRVNCGMTGCHENNGPEYPNPAWGIRTPHKTVSLSGDLNDELASAQGKGRAGRRELPMHSLKVTRNGNFSDLKAVGDVTPKG